jgi:hypothetical protein
MKTLSKAVIAALVFGGSVSVANAAAVITNITATDVSGGTFNSGVIGTDRDIDISKTFSSINPISLTFTVAHQDGGPGNPYSISENVLNSTGQNWVDFHYSITEPDQGNGVVFTEFNSSTFGDFTLDSPPSSGPRNLNFTGNLASGESADAAFNISPFDPGAGNTTTFVLTQVPTIPEPGTYAMLIAGLLLMGGIAKRKGMFS